jgi:CheY-like chemotaxis protein
MPDGGHLVIETANVHLDEATQYLCPGAERGDYVCLTVRDTGVGMSADVKSHAFEPFFTTRGPGRGTGLGLSTVYGIVKQHAGHVYVDSELGEGSTFRIYFPRSLESPSGDESAEPSPLVPSGTETILLVEDDQDLRSYVAMVLRERGYEVVQAASGEEALRIVEGYDGVIHLLLTDVIMPGISGRILAEKLTAVHPGLKVLFMSGYPNDSLAHHGVLRAGIALLQKPFTGVKVLEKLRELLDGA